MHRPSLAEARDLARQALKDAVAGIDPAAKKKADRTALTLKGPVEHYVTEYAKPNKRSWKTDQRLLTVNLVPEPAAV